MANFLYTVVGRFVPEQVTIRKYPAVIAPDPTGDADADAAALEVATAERDARLKPFRFVPLAKNGTDRVKVSRFTLTDAQTAAYLAATDSKARAAVLAGIAPLETASNVSPTNEQLTLMRALTDRETVARNLAAGVLIIPSSRASKASETSKAKSAMTEAERTAAALDALFGAAAPSEPEVSEPQTSSDPA